MNDQPGSSHLQVLFEAALQDYQKQTGIALARHPLANRLQNCDSVESVTAVLREQTQAFSEFQAKDRVLRPLKKAVEVLYKLSATANFGQDIGLNFPPVAAINTGIGVLLSAIMGVTDSYDSLVELLESIENFLRRLDIYTKITPTVAMTEMIIKILVELLSTLALATKQIKEGKSKKLVKKLFGGENDVDAVLQRLDRLTQEEARITAAQTLEVVYCLFHNMRVALDDGKASADHVMEALKMMQQLASDQNKSKRDNLQQDIFKWLSPPDPWKNHHIACKSRHPGSASWFILGNTFSEWKASEAPSSSLWIHGKPGAGKSVFCSAIIEDVDAMRKAGLASLAFFYCDFREEEKMGLRGLLSSLLAQLCYQSEPYCDLLSEFYSEHAKGLRRPSDDALVGCLKELLKLPGQAPVYLIVDALDECPNTSAIPSSRSEVLNVLEELIESRFPNLRICVTSRPETDITDILDPLIHHYVSLHDEGGQKRDIEDYIKSVINTHSKNKQWKAEHKKLVIDVLTKKANGMFRWVECQVVYICGCIPARIKYALADLPETLDETYQRTLREINKAHWEFAHRLLQFVTVASRPLRVEELAELLAFDFNAGPIPRIYDGWRLEDPVDAVLSTCSSLLAIVDGGSLPKTADIESTSETVDSSDGSSEISAYDAFEGEFPPEGADSEYRFGKVIQFSHFSVKEFLTSSRLSEVADIILRRHHVSITPAHTLAAQACLGILLHLDEDVFINDSLAKWPLADYAARHWINHAQFEDVSRNVEDGMKQLFDPSKPHFAIWFRICNRDHSLLQRRRQAENRLTPQGTSLHIAALWGFDSVAEFLIVERSQDVNSRSFTNTIPLHLASIRGHVKAACMLIERGADVTAQNKNGETSLHLASREGQIEVARMLIERGADMNAQGEFGETPLHVALVGAQLEVARMLIERGADATVQGDDGETPLHLASGWGDLEVARMLIESGASVTAKDEIGETPLHLASREGELEVARMLIERGANVTAKDDDGNTVLHSASREGEVEVTRMLIERGADVTAKNEDGETPLHLVSTPSSSESFRESQSQEDYARIADILLKHGADVNTRNTDGMTPFRLASQGELAAVIRVLLKHGADPGEMTASESPPVSRPANTLADLPIPANPGETPLSSSSESPPAASPAHAFADLPISSHPSHTTPNFADIDLPQTPPSPFYQPPSNDVPTLGRNRRPFFFAIRLLCSLGIVAIAVTISFFIRRAQQTPAVGRSI